MYYMYILKSENNKQYYVGHTSNIEDRVIRHNTGRVTATRQNIPWSIFHMEEFADRASALKREYQIKSWKSRRAIERLKSSNKIEDPRFSEGKSGQEINPNG